MNTLFIIPLGQFFIVNMLDMWEYLLCVVTRMCVPKSCSVPMLFALFELIELLDGQFFKNVYRHGAENKESAARVLNQASICASGKWTNVD